MAKGTAACTCCECGKSFTASKILASRDQANSWEEWAKSNIIECDECKEKARQAEREEANKKAAESAKEFELPELTGSEKQVAWANTIRVGYYTEYSKVVDGYTKLTKEQQAKCNEEFEQFNKIVDYVFSNKNSASFWIEHRGVNIRAIVRELESEALKSEEKEEVQEVVSEYPVKPANPATEAIAEVKCADGTLTVSFPAKNEALISVCKSANMKWNSKSLVWERKLSETTGMVDRAIEIGHKLLKAGIPVAIADEATREKAIAGEYEEECLLWIVGGPDDKLAITWKTGDWYKAAYRLAGAKWNSEKQGMLIPVSSFKEIVDFAECNNFKISTLAKGKIDAYEEKINRVKQVIISEHVETEKLDKLKEILNSSGEIPEDLLDD